MCLMVAVSTFAQTLTKSQADSIPIIGINAMKQQVAKYKYYQPTQGKIDSLIDIYSGQLTAAFNNLTYLQPPVVTPPVVVITYKASGTIHYQNLSNVVISGLSVDAKSTGTIAIQLDNCTNVKIVASRIVNSTNDGIQLNNCTNVEISNCFISNVKAGVNAKYSKTINVHNNQFLNMNGPFPSGNFVQFNNVNGSGNRVQNNKCEDIAGVAKHPQDGISIYESNGLPGDSIMVTGNWIRGGQIINDSGGAAAVVLGDVGGSYQVARNNIVVNGGFVGMQVQGGSHIKMDHNKIYGGVTAYSNCGLCFGNYSGQSSYDIYIAYNQVKYFKTNGQEQDDWYDPSTAFQPDGWYTNILGANITPTSLLPTTIITLN